MRMTERPDSEIPLFDPRAYTRLLRGVSFLRHWFEPKITGAEHIPRSEGALIVTNHGHFGMDLPVLLSLVLDATGRPVRALGDRVVFAAPFFRDWAHKLGAIEGAPEAAVELLRDDQLVLVYPGGAREALHHEPRCTGRDAVVVGLELLAVPNLGPDRPGSLELLSRRRQRLRGGRQGGFRGPLYGGRTLPRAAGHRSTGFRPECTRDRL